jgi:hypothetical protein
MGTLGSTKTHKDLDPNQVEEKITDFMREHLDFQKKKTDGGQKKITKHPVKIQVSIHTLSHTPLSHTPLSHTLSHTTLSLSRLSTGQGGARAESDGGGSARHDWL